MLLILFKKSFIQIRRFILVDLGGTTMRDIRKQLIEMLKAEVKPALGCTEPVAVALACAKAKELLDEEIV